jgi:hypothetical protein
MVEIGVQLNPSPLKPPPEGLADRGENVQLLIGSWKDVGVRLAILTPNAILDDTKHVCLMIGEPRLG